MKIIKLSKDFYDRYGHLDEIMQKEGRPYCCLELVIDNKTYAIPFRHNINHQYSFHTIGKSGIDFSKTVLIEDVNMISKEVAIIDSAEWRIIKKNEQKIIAGLLKYIRLYRKAKQKTDIPKYARIIEYSALKYFE